MPHLKLPRYTLSVSGKVKNGEKETKGKVISGENMNTQVNSNI